MHVVPVFYVDDVGNGFYCVEVGFLVEGVEGEVEFEGKEEDDRNVHRYVGGEVEDEKDD